MSGLFRNTESGADAMILMDFLTSHSQSSGIEYNIENAK